MAGTSSTTACNHEDLGLINGHSVQQTGSLKGTPKATACKCRELSMRCSAEKDAVFG